MRFCFRCGNENPFRRSLLEKPRAAGKTLKQEIRKTRRAPLYKQGQTASKDQGLAGKDTGIEVGTYQYRRT
jgi:hypothetical protein